MRPGRHRRFVGRRATAAAAAARGSRRPRRPRPRRTSRLGVAAVLAATRREDRASDGPGQEGWHTPGPVRLSAGRVRVVTVGQAGPAAAADSDWHSSHRDYHD